MKGLPNLPGGLGLDGLDGGKDLNGEGGVYMAVDGTPSMSGSRTTSLDRFMELLAADSTKKVS